MKPYGIVQQEEDWGCGAACVASRLGIGYWEAIELLGRKAGRRGFSGKEVSSALQRRLGPGAYQGRRTPLSVPYDELPTGTILFCGRRGPYSIAGHYLLRTPRGEWMDPYEATYLGQLADGAVPVNVILPG